MYAVTLGSRRSFVTRVSRKPENSISATEIMTVGTGGKAKSLCRMSSMEAPPF